VLCLPAECDRADDPLGREIGEILWPEWFTPEHFAPYKLNARSWNALYQQKPAPDSGDFFQSDWLKPYGDSYPTKKPRRDTLTIYGASDYAVTADGGDYTVHIVVGLDPEGRMFLLDLWRQQSSSDVWVEAMIDMVQVWKPLGWAEEKGQITAGVGPLLTKRLRERKQFIARAQFPTKGDKEIRAQSIRGRMAMDGLYCPFHAPWFPAFKAELMSFPVGRNDDQADALGLIGQVLDRMVRGRPTANDPDRPKVLSTDPSKCTVTLEDMFQANEKRRPARNLRIA
jgi:predicted phage terminase large subunit-like protein